MRGGKRKPFELVVENAAAVMLAGAFGFSVHALLAGRFAAVPLIALSAVAGCVGYLLGRLIMRQIGGEGVSYELRAFTPGALSFEAPEELLLTEQVELLLTDAERLRPSRSSEDELVLDDILAKLGNQSRVVRLFDPAAMPTPGQLNARIEDHLRHAPTKDAAPDASEALYQALTELRRSLR